VKSETSEPTIIIEASALPCRKPRFGRPYTMLNALSSTLKNDSDDQSRKAPPTMPSAVAFDWMPRTARRIESIEVLGNVFESSRTKNEPSSA
jgi:hypothetical protein